MAEIEARGVNDSGGRCQLCGGWVERGGGSDWRRYVDGDVTWGLQHDECPAIPSPPPQRPQRPMRRLDCGHYSSEVLNTSRGTSCPRCYDRMSD